MGPLKFVVPALLTVTAVKPLASAAPPAPNNPATFTVPVPASSLRLSSPPPAVPLVAPVMVIAPAPAAPCVESVTSVPSAIVSAPPMLSSVLVVVTLFASDTGPLVEKPPGAVIAPVGPLVKVPEFVTASAPVVVKLSFTLNAVPVNAAEPTFTAPSKVVATEPAL